MRDKVKADKAAAERAEMLHDLGIFVRELARVTYRKLKGRELGR